MMRRCVLNGSGTTDEDAALSSSVSCTDVDGDALEYLLVSGAVHGTLVFNSDGTFVYTPAANYHGADSFTFKANDGLVDSNVATFSITVTPVNDAPVCANDSGTVAEDEVLADAVDVHGRGR